MSSRARPSECDTELEKQLKEHMNLRLELGAEVAKALSNSDVDISGSDGLERLRQELRSRRKSLSQ